jgi:hypothetical protein
MTRDSNVNVTSERNPQARGADKRSQPFVSVLLTGVFVVPAFGLILRLIAFFSPDLLWLIGGLDLVLFGVAGPLIAVGVGYKVSKRIPFVIWHVAVTVELFALATYVTATVGWPPVNAEWYLRLLAVVKWPGAWVILHLFGSVFVALSWLLYRINAFRAATGTEKEDSGIAALVKWPVGAKIRKDSITVDDVAVEAIVDHAGVPIAQLRQALPALEENPGVIRGRSSVAGGEHGGQSTIRLVHTDPHRQWRVWPGLSHPGGRYHEPLRTSYYSTGEIQWYSFVRTPDGYRSKFAPKFRSPNDTFAGAQGATGSGKSGDSAIELGEVFSRTDVQVIYVDTAKLLQNAGWCLDFVSLAAGSLAASGALFAALRKLGEYRSRILGEAGVRNFNAEAVDLTGLSWVHIFADEFDVAKQGAAIDWLSTKGRSLGFRLSLVLPRATAEKMSADVRGAIGMWKQFGITQDYDKGFVLSEETIAAGANPEAFGVTLPGVHYLDRAPGIDASMYAVDCRTFRTREDYGDLRRAVEAARATFTPMTWTPGELEVLGEVAKICRPSVVRTGHLGQDDEPAAGPIYVPAARPQAYDPDNQEGKGMETTQQLSDDDLHLDAETRALLEDNPVDDVSDVQAEYGPINPREPIPDQPDDGITLVTPKPRAANRQQAVEQLEAALIRMAVKGVREFGNADVRDEMTVDMSASWISERFTDLTEGAMVAPPGLTIERLARGRFMLTRVAEHGHAPA